MVGFSTASGKSLATSSMAHLGSANRRRRYRMTLSQGERSSSSVKSARSSHTCPRGDTMGCSTKTPPLDSVLACASSFSEGSSAGKLRGMGGKRGSSEGGTYMQAQGKKGGAGR